ncbi:extracellular solute-binding protein [Massilia endophytica]|uniref:extracellular solute-binding protein n=1 Tax=Massilia endophytica TaxID=2899220 RepID=UPI001E3036E9|nr:extracellular solute-binding protein [Massilia endophytica]UGQ45192.1 extracellular solute-binding protein [Massilia endophytica]
MTPMKPAALAALMLACACAQAADGPVINLYSSRHYHTDPALYENFTKQTGIAVNRIEAGENEVVERIRNEGPSSPADVLVTVDLVRLARANAEGLLAPVQSAVLNERIPAHLRTNDWFAFSVRTRVIVHNKSVKAEWVQNYEDLSHPRLKGKLCVRNGGHPYNISLGASMIEHNGERKTEQWAKGVVANMARPPKGGDLDQVRGVAGGECGVALTNSYYLGRLLRSEKPEDRKLMENIEIVFPNQKNYGTHVNVSGAGVLKNAPNRENAIKFLEYLASDEAQVYFADGNNEWPAVPTAKSANPGLAKLGSYKGDKTPLGRIAKHLDAVPAIYEAAGWK